MSELAYEPMQRVPTQPLGAGSNLAGFQSGQPVEAPMMNPMMTQTPGTNPAWQHLGPGPGRPMTPAMTTGA